MKKSSILFAGIIGMMMTSCGFSSEEKPLTDELVTYTAKGNEKGEVLLGVKENGKDGKTIITPAEYSGITADDYVISCSYADGNIDIYTLEGTPIGNKTYQAFNSSKNEGKVYYTGKNGDETSIVYFPGKDVLICETFYKTEKNLYVKGKGVWDIYDFEGQKIWSFKEDAIVLKSTSTQEMIIATPQQVKLRGTKKSVTMGALYTPDGKKIKKFNAYQWSALLKKLKEKTPTEIGSTKFYELEKINL